MLKTLALVFLPLQLGHLTDQSNCRLQYRDAKIGAGVCLREPVLTSSQCYGQLHEYSPLQNQVGLFRKITVQPKPILKKIIAENCNLPDSNAATQFASQFLNRIDRFRVLLSERLAPLDETGAFRSLLLNEKVRSEFDSRAEGLGQLVSASAIHVMVLFAFIEWLLLKALKGCGERSFRVFWVTLVLVKTTLFFFIFILSGLKFSLIHAFILISFRKFLRRFNFYLSQISIFIFLVLVETAICWFSDRSFEAGLFYCSALFGVLILINFKHSRRFFKSIQFVFAIGLSAAFINLIHHHEWAVLNPIWAVFALPLSAFVLYPALILYSFAPCVPIEWLLGFLNRVLVLFEQGPVKLDLRFLVNPNYLILGFSISLLFHFFIRRTSFRVLVLIAFVLFRFNSENVFKTTPKETYALSIEQLDVGQGDAALVRYLVEGDSRVHSGLIDAGSVHSLKPIEWRRLFSQRDIQSLDFIVFSHLDEDHVGGVRNILSELPVKCAATSSAQLNSDRGQRLYDLFNRWQVPLIDFRSNCFPFLVAENESSKKTSSRANELMNAFLIPFKDGGYFFTLGDSTQKRELEVFEKFKNQLENRDIVLKISHHGSRTSTSTKFIEKLRPSLTLISVGVGNRYSHPNSETLETLEKHVLRTVRTDQMGSILVTVEDVHRR